MIVQPNFPDHWKTQMLVQLLEDPAGPVYVLRLWGHCQNAKAWRFEKLTPQAIRAICRYPGDAKKLDDALCESGYLRRVDAVVEVLNWEKHNAGLIASWENGKLGGRPKSAAAAGVEVASRPRVTFDDFWAAFPESPKKVRRDYCLDMWKRLNLDRHADWIVADVEAKKKGDWKTGNEEFMPSPDGYLYQRRWEQFPE
jgi:hypothetical protein